jgi:chemotaxis protein CheX
MNYDMITSALKDSVLFILAASGFEKLSANKLQANQGSCELVVTTGITGQIKGILMVQIGLHDGLIIANKMLANIDPAQVVSAFSETHKGALSEITNLFTGRFLNLLSEQNIDCNLTPPMIISGTDIVSQTRNVEETIEFSVEGDGWVLHISLCIMASRS